MEIDKLYFFLVYDCSEFFNLIKIVVNFLSVHIDSTPEVISTLRSFFFLFFQQFIYSIIITEDAQLGHHLCLYPCKEPLLFVKNERLLLISESTEIILASES